MSYTISTGTTTTSAGIMTALDSFLTTAGWTQEKSGTISGSTYYIYSSDGELTTEDLYIGTFGAVHPTDPTNQSSIQLNMYTSYAAAQDFITMPGAIKKDQSLDGGRGSFINVPAVPHVTGSTVTYWLFGDKDAVIVVLKSGVGIYHSAYIGRVNRWLPFACDCRNMLVTASGNACVNQSDYNVQDNNWAFALQSGSGTGKCQAYMRDQYGFGLDSSQAMVQTLVTNFDLGYAIYKNLENSPSSFGGGFVLAPLYVVSANAGWRGYLKHCFAVGNAQGQLSSEETFDVGGNGYIAFMNPNSSSDVDRWVAIRNYV